MFPLVLTLFAIADLTRLKCLGTLCVPRYKNCDREEDLRIQCTDGSAYCSLRDYVTYGNSCTDPCPSFCNNQGCDWATGSLVCVCEPGWGGQNCRQRTRNGWPHGLLMGVARMSKMR